MLKIKIPTHCPTCESELYKTNDQLYCGNNQCPAKISKKIEHFAKTLKIKGLGPKTLEKLDLSTYSELFMLTETEIADRIGSEKLASKLYSELNNAAKAPANLVLPAFGVPLIGKTATEKLSTVCDSLFDIDKDSCARAGLGPKATENLLTWLETDFAEIASLLPFSHEFSKKRSMPLNRGTVCITGKLKSCKTKAEAKEKLEAAGYEVKSSLTQTVTILLNESGVESAKTKQARDNNVRVVTDITTLIGD